MKVQLKSSLTLCKDYLKASVDFAKHPLKGCKAGYATFSKDMNIKQKLATTLKIVAAAVVIGSIGAAIGATLGFITPVLAFTAVPLFIGAAIIGGVSMAAFLLREDHQRSLFRIIKDMRSIHEKINDKAASCEKPTKFQKIVEFFKHLPTDIKLRREQANHEKRNNEKIIEIA